MRGDDCRPEIEKMGGFSVPVPGNGQLPTGMKL